MCRILRAKPRCSNGCGRNRWRPSLGLWLFFGDTQIGVRSRKFERGKMNYNGDIRKGEKEQLLKEVLSGLDCMRLTKHVC
jgi:hypothetical protein